MSRGKQRLLLIRGLGHSGTTILDLALGAHPQITGLGEAVRLLEKPAAKDSHRGPAQLRGDLRHQRLCTCGQVADACPVWGAMLRWLINLEYKKMKEDEMHHGQPAMQAGTFVVPRKPVTFGFGNRVQPVHEDAAGVSEMKVEGVDGIDT